MVIVDRREGSDLMGKVAQGVQLTAREALRLVLWMDCELNGEHGTVRVAEKADWDAYRRAVREAAQRA